MELLILAGFALVSVARGEAGARLLTSKCLFNRYAVEGKDLALQYNSYSVGSKAVNLLHGSSSKGHCVRPLRFMIHVFLSAKSRNVSEHLLQLMADTCSYPLHEICAAKRKQLINIADSTKE